MLRDMIREAFETFCIIVYLSLPIVAITVAIPLGVVAGRCVIQLLRN